MRPEDLLAAGRMGRETPDRQQRLDDVARLTRAGRTAREIAETLGCSRRQVARDRRTLRLSPPPTPPLTAAQLAEAERLLEDGASFKEVARTVGCVESTIRRRFPGRGWTLQQAAEHSALLHRERRRR